MFKAVDSYTFTVSAPLTARGDAVGTFTASYQVAHYDHVQLRSGAMTAGALRRGSRRYVLSVTQRVTILNQTGTVIGPVQDGTAYADYPALLNVQFVSTLPAGVSWQLLGYSPQTADTQVQMSGTTGSQSGTTGGSSTSRTAGSSTAQTNSYSMNVGMSGDVPSFGASAETSTTNTTEQSRTSTTESGMSRSNDASTAASISIKDWGAYALVDPETGTPIWTFGQEYPWDAIGCRQPGGGQNPAPGSDQVELIVPDAMKVRLHDGSVLYPPSHLSRFGVDFATHAQWIVTVDGAELHQIDLQHLLQYSTASHSLTGTGDAAGVAVYIDSQPAQLMSPSGVPSATLDLGVLGLDPVGTTAAPAVVGFAPAKFATPPAPAAAGTAPTNFAIFANPNTLLVRDTTSYPQACTSGAGFSADRAALTATLMGNCTSLTYTVLFKVVDTSADYHMHFKHWKTTAAGVVLTIVVNGDEDTAVTKYVDSAEAAGGEGNLLSVAVRNQDFASEDHCDLLTMGLNSVAATITPMGHVASAGYALRALSVESS